MYITFVTGTDFQSLLTKIVSLTLQSMSEGHIVTETIVTSLQALMTFSCSAGNKGGSLCFFKDARCQEGHSA